MRLGFHSLLVLLSTETVLLRWLAIVVRRALSPCVRTAMVFLAGVMSLHGHGAYHDVVDDITAKLEVTPEDAALRFKLACAHQEHGEWKQALIECERVRRLSSGVHDVELIEGKALGSGGHWEAAKGVLDVFLTKQPRHASALAERGKVLWKLGKRVEAQNDFAEALRLDSRAPAAWWLEAAQAGEALRCVDALQRIAPRAEPWMARRAEVLAASNRDAEARAAWAALHQHLMTLPNLERGTPLLAGVLAKTQQALGIAALSTTKANFLSNWFGANPPATLQVGSYTGGGIGLSAGGDAVNLYNTNNVRVANVAFGIAPSSAPYRTFDNAAAANVASVSSLSQTGVNGAFAASSNPSEIGSPGVITGGAVGFAVWLAQNGFTGTPGADSDNDGVSDTLEYFFNTSPNNPADRAHLPAVVREGVDLEFRFTRLQNSALTGTLRYSTDLLTWQNAVQGVDFEIISQTVSGGQVEVRYRLLNPINAKFFQLRVE